MSAILTTIAITGGIQLWDRTCDAHARCGLPQALTAKLPVAGSVTEPERAGTFQEFHLPLEQDGRVVDFQVLWVAPPDGSKPYLVAQSRVRENGRLITECTQYAAADKPVFFPVGACSGFIPNEDGTTRQVGVTFYKER